MKFPQSEFNIRQFREFWRHQQSESLHTARNWSKADVSRLQWPPNSGNWVVVKDMSARPLWFRVLAGRYFLQREWRALRALDGIRGIPRAFGMLSPDILVMEWCAGVPSSKLRKNEVAPASLEQLSELLSQIHARGVTHGDLHRENVLVAENGAISLIDWATASVFRSRFNPLKMWTQREWRDLDRRAVAKIKAKHAPQSLSENEKNLLLNGSGVASLVRSAGRIFRTLLGRQSPSSPADARRRLERDLAKAEREK